MTISNRQRQTERADAPDGTVQTAVSTTALPHFPVMLRKMWSGGEVQRWIEENIAPLLRAGQRDVPTEPASDQDRVGLTESERAELQECVSPELYQSVLEAIGVSSRETPGVFDRLFVIQKGYARQYDLSIELTRIVQESIEDGKLCHDVGLQLVAAVERFAASVLAEERFAESEGKGAAMLASGAA